ncbi:inovirus-type Gp2 protein [uncultured Psychrosphaera sp.]|uniref:YagK/YfjJ domain-containing protein n=1 Tax=uncultured Psychrosphaera sp. TaxID=1403522 RepID=UPI0034329348
MFFNRDCYWILGDFQQRTSSLSTKVAEAWASALKPTIKQTIKYNKTKINISNS